MSDAQLRALERRWRETRDAVDLRAWLRARQQTGELDDRLLLAGHLRDPLALELLGKSPKAFATLGLWYETALTLAQHTGHQDAAARAQYVLTGKAGPPPVSRALDVNAFRRRVSSSLADLLLPLAAPRPPTLEAAVAALKARVDDPELDLTPHVAAVTLVRADYADLLPPEVEARMVPPEDEGALDLDVELQPEDLRWLARSFEDGELTAEELATARPLIAFFATLSACGGGGCRLALAELAVGSHDAVIGPIGRDVSPWVLGYD